MAASLTTDEGALELRVKVLFCLLLPSILLPPLRGKAWSRVWWKQSGSRWEISMRKVYGTKQPDGTYVYKGSALSTSLRDVWTDRYLTSLEEIKFEPAQRHVYILWWGWMRYIGAVLLLWLVASDEDALKWIYAWTRYSVAVVLPWVSPVALPPGWLPRAEEIETPSIWPAVDSLRDQILELETMELDDVCDIKETMHAQRELSKVVSKWHAYFSEAMTNFQKKHHDVLREALRQCATSELLAVASFTLSATFSLWFIRRWSKFASYIYRFAPSVIDVSIKPFAASVKQRPRLFAWLAVVLGAFGLWAAALFVVAWNSHSVLCQAEVDVFWKSMKPYNALVAEREGRPTGLLFSDEHLPRVKHECLLRQGSYIGLLLPSWMHEGASFIVTRVSTLLALFISYKALYLNVLIRNFMRARTRTAEAQNRKFETTVNFCLNFVEGGVLKFRTLFETPLIETFARDDALIDLVLKAADQTGEEDEAKGLTVDDALRFFPLWRLPREKAKTINMLILNRISELGKAGFLEQEAGIRCITTPYVFSLTCERQHKTSNSGTSQHFEKKLRVMLIRKELLQKLHVRKQLGAAEKNWLRDEVHKKEFAKYTAYNELATIRDPDGRPRGVDDEGKEKKAKASRRIALLQAMASLYFEPKRWPLRPSKQEKGWSVDELELVFKADPTSIENGNLSPARPAPRSLAQIPGPRPSSVAQLSDARRSLLDT
jgi:hypothetical protein